ncbi:hypothetical protein [Nitrospirillum sp. BR 11828]|uniref:ABC transporter permease n=1 Tax=Nitrospirillum sp. BR 11828 TaxID=3104325 RepID=UPI002ACAC25E|nr:hypothetical protein [Nitrospirillum sp. BR 11828]MDZ5650731.1 hypothetical protein [Nitrospirillum sp. BR 11828]
MGGARRRDLVTQFMLETLILVGIAMVIALSLTELAIPQVSRFLDARLSLDAASPEVGPLSPAWARASRCWSCCWWAPRSPIASNSC